MRSKRSLLFYLPLLFIGSLFILQSVLVLPTYALSRWYWDDVGTDCDIKETDCNKQVIKQFSGETRYVHQTGTYVKAYFKTNEVSTVTIHGANFCPNLNSALDTIQSGDYYSTHENELISGEDNVTLFSVEADGWSNTKYGTYYSKGQAQCNEPVVLQVIPAEDTTITLNGKPLYVAKVFVTNILSSPSGKSGIVNYFDMQLEGSNAYRIAQFNEKGGGGDGTMEKVYDGRDSGNDDFTDYKVRFGTPCTITQRQQIKVSWYDLDNQPSDPSGAQKYRKIWMTVDQYDENNKKTQILNFTPDNKVNTSDDSDLFWAYPGNRYEWTIHDVYENNVIQVSPPKGYDSIFWENTPDNPLCLNKTYTYPNTTLDNGNVSISATNGSNHTFRHYVDVDRFAPNHGGTVNWKVQTKTNNGAWTDTGRSGTEKIEKDQVDNADALVNTGPYTAPATGEGQYCEQLVLSNPQKPEDVGIRYTTSQALCVNYGSGGPGPGGLPIKTVEFKTQGGGGDVKDEPEVTVDVDGSSLSGTLGVKPNTNELGYQNQSKYIDPQPVYETEHPIGTSTDGEKTVPDDYPATCILRTELVNGSWVPVVPNVCEVYTCPNGGSLSGTTCVKSHQEYHYYCIVTNLGYVDRGWHASDPGCGYSDYDSCPDGTPARLGQPSGQRRACNDAWTCAYGKLWTNVGKPYCEFRCDGGTGNKAILAESRIMTNSPQGNQFETWGNGDTNCYKPWQVTVSCQITYTDNGGRWISSGSRRVVNGTVQTWPETITTDERGNMTSYCNNPPGGYWATQYEYGRVGSQGCMALSLVSISIFTDTPPSPLSPNNRQVKTVYWNRAIVGGAAQKCWTSVGRPYAQFNNTDISTMTCGTGAGNVKMYAMDEYGSSVEYAAYVAGTISSLRTNYNNGSQGLAFASDGSKTIGGGQFASKSGGDCNYYDSLANSSGSFVQSRIKIYDGDITVDQGLVNSIITSTGSYAIFANNITVNGNINLSFKLSNDPNNPNETGAKVLYLIAKNNINVNANVTNLDAMLISNKNINTCSGSPNQCENNLVINGGLAAGTVQFKRTGKSSLNCARPGHGSVCNEYQYPAELINYGAYYELFLPPFKPVSGLDQGRYDSIKSVAPIF